MDEINILYKHYEETGKEIYLKSLYAMCISKIENRVLNILEIYNKLLENSHFIVKQLENGEWKKKVNKRILNELNQKNLIKTEVLDEFDYTLLKMYVEIEESNLKEVQKLADRFSDKLKKIISCNPTGRLPQDVEKINELLFEVVRKKLFTDYTIEERDLEIIEGMELKITSTQIIDSYKTFSEIYSRRQKSVHLDFVDSIDSLKLKNQLKAMKLILQQLDEFEKIMRNNRSMYNDETEI